MTVRSVIDYRQSERERGFAVYILSIRPKARPPGFLIRLYVAVRNMLLDAERATLKWNKKKKKLYVFHTIRGEISKTFNIRVVQAHASALRIFPRRHHRVRGTHAVIINRVRIVYRPPNFRPCPYSHRASVGRSVVVSSS